MNGQNKAKLHACASGYLHLDNCDESGVKRNQALMADHLRVDLSAGVERPSICLVLDDSISKSNSLSEMQTRCLHFTATLGDLLPSNSPQQPIQPFTSKADRRAVEQLPPFALLSETTVQRSVGIRCANSTPVQVRMTICEDTHFGFVDYNGSLTEAKSGGVLVKTKELVVNPSHTEQIVVQFRLTSSSITSAGRIRQSKTPRSVTPAEVYSEQSGQLDLVAFSPNSDCLNPLFVNTYKLQLRVKVFGPSLRILTQGQLDFGTVYINVSRTMEIRIINEGESRSLWIARIEDVSETGVQIDAMDVPSKTPRAKSGSFDSNPFRLPINRGFLEKCSNNESKHIAAIPIGFCPP
ncbi:unnamed protein product [Dicrocoelium dendriticum]|nr:unnamed protein product [Dicrocoelium dendriticum]